MSIEIVALLMLASTLLLLMTGLPMAFTLGAVGMVFVLLLMGPAAMHIPLYTLWGLMNNFLFIAIPMFIFMGVVLEKSGLADDLFQMIYTWAGPVKGGLAMGIVVICVIFAAMAGTSGAATVSLGMIAIPSLLRRGYDKKLVTGTIQAGGALGFLIPPSVTMIIYGLIGQVSVGKLYAAGIFPGLLLTGLFIAYIGIRCLFQPGLGPAMPKEERNFTLKQKVVSMQAVILPILLILAVLGSMFAGIATPTEAAGIGAAGALVVAAVHRRMSFAVLKETMFRTGRVVGMVMWVAFAAIAYSAIFDFLGGGKLIQQLIASMQLSPWGVLIIFQLTFFILGFFLDDIAILFLVMPIYIPIIAELGFDPVWFGVLYVINAQMAFLTPPFGYNLFYMKAVSTELFNSGDIAERITMGEIYRSIVPFVALQMTGLILCMIFPQIVLWLPNRLYGS